jgi:hypothetical protein
MTAADALVAELRELGLGAEPAGDWVQVTIAGLPLTPLLIIPAPRPDILAPPPGTGPVWTWRRDTGARSHHLAAVDSLAGRWGQWGDSVWRMPRAIEAAPAGPAAADHDGNTHQASIHPRDRRGHGILRVQARKSTRPCR